MQYYNDGKIFIPTLNRQYPPATTGLDRPSSFYDRTLVKEFQKNFQFEYPNIENEEIEQEKNSILKKKRTR